MQQKRYWLRGLGIGAVVGIILYILNVLVVFLLEGCYKLSSDQLGMCGLFTAWTLALGWLWIVAGLFIGTIIGLLYRNKIYWLRFEVTLVITYVVIGAISYALFMNCSANTPGPDGFGCLKYSIPLIIATAPIFETLNEFLPNSVIFIINALIWFLVGSIIGLIYGKIKNRNMDAM
jgi:hypothetical protein